MKYVAMYYWRHLKKDGGELLWPLAVFTTLVLVTGHFWLERLH